SLRRPIFSTVFTAPPPEVTVALKPAISLSVSSSVTSGRTINITSYTRDICIPFPPEPLSLQPTTQFSGFGFQIADPSTGRTYCSINGEHPSGAKAPDSTPSCGTAEAVPFQNLVDKNQFQSPLSVP